MARHLLAESEACTDFAPIDALCRDLQAKRDKFNAQIDAALSGCVGGFALFSVADASREITRIVEQLLIETGWAGGAE